MTVNLVLNFILKAINLIVLHLKWFVCRFVYRNLYVRYIWNITKPI